MKKYYNFLIILLITCFIVPQVAFASWWNPFSWSIWGTIFHKQERIETQIKKSAEKESVSTPTEEIDIKNDNIDPVDVPMDIKKDPSVVKDATSVTTNIVTPEQPGPNIPDSFKDLKTGKLLTVSEITKNAVAECESLNSVINKENPLNSDGTANCITYNQACQNKFGIHSFASKEKDINGNKLCACEDGYESTSSNIICHLEQVNDYNPPYLGSGTSFSPEQLNAMDCAWYGINCDTTNIITPTTITDTISQPLSSPNQATDCLKYKAEKEEWEDYASQHGILYSGTNLQKQKELKLKYPGCN